MLVFALLAALIGVLTAGCGSGQPPATPAGSGDAAFRQLAKTILDDRYRRHPSEATDLGLHQYDDQLEDRSQGAISAEVDALKDFRSKLTAVDPAWLTATHALDRKQLLHAMDEGVLRLDTIKMWAKDPDTYSSTVTNAAYVIMKRDYAPASERLRSLIAREKKMPAALEQARVNLTIPVRIYTEIAIEQLDGNISFFKNDVPAAFKGVTDNAMLAELAQVNGEVMRALGAYKVFLQQELLPKATNSFAYGADTYVKALAAFEDVNLPLDRLLQVAESDR